LPLRLSRALLGLPAEVASADLNSRGEREQTLSRFIFDERNYSIPKLRPKPRAFYPPSDGSGTSAFVVDGLLDPEIWWIGENIVAKRSQREPPSARADILSVAVLKAQLTIEPDAKDHPLHVNICGWPTEKEKRLAVAQDLCAVAILKLR